MYRSLAAAVAMVIVLAALATAAQAQAPKPADARDLLVAVSYVGKGTVDDTHEILVFLFDHPNPTAESVPLAVQPIQKSGGMAKFTNVSAPAVYVVMVYDELANYDGLSGPPPKGAPIATYSRNGKPVPVKPGPNTRVVTAFDDSRRWGK